MRFRRESSCARVGRRRHAAAVKQRNAAGHAPVQGRCVGVVANPLYRANDSPRARILLAHLVDCPVADDADARRRFTKSKGKRNEHRAAFDTVHVARIECADAANADALAARLVAGEIAFFDAAQHAYLAAPEREHMVFATLRRRDVSNTRGEAIFAAKEGDIVAAAGSVVKVLSVKPASLDATTRAAIEELLFEQWLAERRRTATITWHWGRADWTPDAA